MKSLVLKIIFAGVFMLSNVAAAEKTILLGGGCFWCVEAVFKRIDGITSTEVGYAGGPANTNYKKVSLRDGNIEVAKISFDDEKISLEKVLQIFFSMHDVTSLDKQGEDIGVQYRSAIFYESEDDKEFIEKFIKNAQKSYSKKIVTKLYKTSTYTRAEDYHQRYFDKNKDTGYCQFVIAPKLEKLGLE